MDKCVNSIEEIKSAGRWVGRRIGAYNHEVVVCVRCSERLSICEGDNAGFGEPSFLNITSNDLAVVSLCPRCGKRQWSHGDMGSFRHWQRWQHFR